jgi:hypothetical protein
MIFGAVSSNNGSSLTITCFSVRSTTDTPLPVERSLYDSSELRSFTIEELIDLWGSEVAKTSACAGQSTCSGCTAYGNCKWCSGQQACKPAHTNEVCTQGFYTVQQCKQRVSQVSPLPQSACCAHCAAPHTHTHLLPQTTNWYGRLAGSDKHGLYVSFIFTPAKRFFSSWEHNAIGIYVGPTQATATTPVMLRQQRTESGAQGCVDQLGSQPTSTIPFLPLALCNFDRKMEYTLYVAHGSVGLVDMVSVSTSSGYHHAFGGPIPTSGFWRLAMLGGAISDIYLVTKEEVFVRGHFKKGATRAVQDVFSRGLCPEGEAECGDKCWTVCTDCDPPRYCVRPSSALPGPFPTPKPPPPLTYPPPHSPLPPPPPDVLPHWLHRRVRGVARGCRLPKE